MSHELSKAYDPSAIEERWAEYWVRERLFDVATPADTSAATKKFTMLLPPPNVTGRLHMGHMLNQAEMDILTRWHRMSGDVSMWVPGTDHAGIATQMMVERQLASEGSSRQQLGREAFTARVWEWKNLYGGAILDQMKRLGASVDWSREYFTMDDRLSVAVKEAFVRLHEQGLIYRGAYIVNWDPQIRTAVSDLEVVHEERAGKLYSLRYPFADGTGSIVIATTRPETMLGDTAVVVNPTDERYLGLHGKFVRLPLSGVDGGPDREIPILADDWAKPEFGTGAVKVTPAHDPNDFAIGQRHNLPNLTILDETAHVLLPGSPYNGLDRYVAREKILADLGALGLLVEVKDHTLAIGLSQRSGVVIEPRLSNQWFVKIAPLAEKAIRAVDEGHIKFTPDQYRKTYDEWMRNIHDWCISRQLWWGHRIPAWHCSACSKITVARETPATCSHCHSAEITQETDVLDTWFSSGLLPFTVFGWPENTPDLAAFYPTQLLVTGFDILFFWVARMIMLGTHFMLDVPMPDGSPRTLKDAVPFQEVYIHALVRDADRQKMSKTKGNVIDPIDIIGRFGTDAVRFTLASMASPGTDIAFSEARTEGNRAFANKIWNAARFLFMNVDRAAEAGVSIDLTQLAAALNSTEDAPLETRWILSRLHAASAAVEKSLTDYRFDEAANAIYQFFWGDFCDWYIEIVKLRLEFGEGADLIAAKAALTTLLAVFEAALRLLSPFMPFITEEIWHAFYDNITPEKSIALTRFPSASEIASDPASVAAMETLQQLIVTVRGLRKEIAIPEKEFAHITVSGNSSVLKLAGDNKGLLFRLARVSDVAFATATLSGDNARSTADFDVAVIYERQIDVPAERERLTKDIARFEKGLAAANRQLGNETFMSKAPAHIVDGLRKQSSETQMLYDKAKSAFDALPPE
ncbi:valine--tRNA ligase [Granulicella arctica]|uniref:valine--tRNA ligase n=1 Tax=Granulicella arctica TaxID=940613 RepID=UPI0021DF72A3|nr:valine--tRNA ligase [Granulicella arctica]